MLNNYIIQNNIINLTIYLFNLYYFFNNKNLNAKNFITISANDLNNPIKFVIKTP